MSDQLNYDESLIRIEEILTQLEEGKIGMEETTELVKEASALISKCKNKLKIINEEISKAFQ